MRKFSIIPDVISRKIDEELAKADIKKSASSLFSQSLIISVILSVIILLVFFRNNLRIAANFTDALIQYYLLSLSIAIAILFFYNYSIISLRKIKRKKEIELVLADYLQLVASNLTAGMPIDQAMWYAVRERFGVLAEEIEIVARKVTGGIDLEEALLEFTNKYDSQLLKRSFALLIEGLKSGGELSDLVSKISWDIKESQILEKEILAEVTTYVIFIIIASVIIAPLLYALSHRIIIIMSQVLGKIDFGNFAGVSSTLPLRFTGNNIMSPDDFRIFIYINLTITSVLAAMIVSTIKKGSIKAGLKLIPIFLSISIILHLLISILLSSLLKD